MAVLLLQYVKLIMLFLLVGSVIALSRFGGENRNGSGLAAADGAAFVPNYGPGTEQLPFEPLLG